MEPHISDGATIPHDRLSCGETGFPLERPDPGLAAFRSWGAVVHDVTQLQTAMEMSSAALQ